MFSKGTCIQKLKYYCLLSSSRFLYFIYGNYGNFQRQSKNVSHYCQFHGLYYFTVLFLRIFPAKNKMAVILYTPCSLDLWNSDLFLSQNSRRHLRFND